MPVHAEALKMKTIQIKAMILRVNSSLMHPPEIHRARGEGCGECVQRGPERKPGASSYTRQRLSLSQRVCAGTHVHIEHTVYRTNPTPPNTLRRCRRAPLPAPAPPQRPPSPVPPAGRSPPPPAPPPDHSHRAGSVTLITQPFHNSQSHGQSYGYDHRSGTITCSLTRTRNVDSDSPTLGARVRHVPQVLHRVQQPGQRRRVAP